MKGLTETINKLRGKTVAIVYIFENETAPGFDHYWVWKSNIITGWMKAIQELKCVPYILDVRTFVQKAIFGTLPCIDFVLNLNCGSINLSSMSLVPSVCSFLSIPCIPCDSSSIIMSENKSISNLIARSMGLKVPKDLDRSVENGIYRPLNLGSSIGILRGHHRPISNLNEGTYQEFIYGYDITIPMVFNFESKKMDLMPTVLYLPKTRDPKWFFNAEEKVLDNGFDILFPSEFNSSLKEKILKFAEAFPITTFGRIDARIKCNSPVLSEDIVNEKIGVDDLYFIEINSMPTIENDDSFEYSMDEIKKRKNHSLFNCVNFYEQNVESATINGYLLASAMLAHNHVSSSKRLYP